MDNSIKCLCSFFENELLNCLTNAVNFSILADETTDIAEGAVLNSFVQYVNEHHKIVEPFLELTEVVRSKGAEQLRDIIKEVLNAKGIDISQLRFHGNDGTNKRRGERFVSFNYL